MRSQAPSTSVLGFMAGASSGVRGVVLSPALVWINGLAGPLQQRLAARRVA